MRDSIGPRKQKGKERRAPSHAAYHSSSSALAAALLGAAVSFARMNAALVPANSGGLMDTKNMTRSEAARLLGWQSERADENGCATARDPILVYRERQRRALRQKRLASFKALGKLTLLLMIALIARHAVETIVVALDR
jgi:hypothetical protein